MVFKLNAPAYSTEIQRKEGETILYINYLGASSVPSIADSAETMARAVDALTDNPEVSRIIFVQQRNYNYPFEQVSILLEISQLYTFLLKQERILAPDKLGLFVNLEFAPRELSYLLSLLRQDPVACYLEVIKRIGIYKKNLKDSRHFDAYLGILDRFRELLLKTRLISSLIDVVDTYAIGDRKVYYSIFRPDILPNFTLTRLVAQMPEDAEIMDQYELKSGFESVSVMILKVQGDAKYLYHIMPPEYALSEEHHLLLNLGKSVLLEYQPKSEEFVDSEKVRSLFFNVARDLLSELSVNKNIPLNYRELNSLARILVRQTIGFGLVEVLLFDDKLQDIFLNSPIGQNYVFVRHAKYGDCVTNILPSYEDADSWASKLRLQSGRPLDEANPILDTDIFFGNIRARVAAIQRPLSPTGIAYALRRHREEPWTLPLFIENKMINSFTAGLMSFLVDGNMTMLIAGTRSSGKCVDGNTLIQLGDGSIQKIKDLVGAEKKKIEDGIIYNPLFDAKVKTLDKFSISSKTITDVWVRESPSKLIKIKTRSGKEITTTFEHPYFVYNYGLKNKRADELKKGDLIVSPRTLSIIGKEKTFDLRNKPYFKSETESYSLLGGGTNSLSVKFPKKLTKELAEFIGLVIGDGHLDIHKLEFHNICKELRERYVSLLAMFGIKYRIFDSRTTTVVQVTARALNKVISEVFEIPFGNKSSKVVIPKVILQSDDSILAAFLRGYFDTDGYVSKNKRDMELVTASKIMSEHLRLSLLRFGISSFVKPKIVNGVTYYRVFIRGTFVKEFASKIGFNHPSKKQRLKFILNNLNLDNTNIDVIPQGNLIMRELRYLLRVSPKKFRESGKDYWAYENEKYRTSRKWFGKISNFYHDYYNQLISMKYQIKYLNSLIIRLP